MPKNRDFLDYVHLGAELVQTANTIAIRDHLSALSELEAAKLTVVQRECAAQEREHKTRDFVFNAAQLIADMKVDAVASDPCRSLVLFYELRRYVEKLAITTTSVRTYEDKERTHQFLKTLKQAIADCEGRLDGQTREKAERCERFKAEQPELDELIQFEATRAQIQTLNSELEALGPFSRPVVPMFLSAIVICIGILLFLIASARGLDPQDLTTGLCVILGLIVFPLGILMLRSKTPLPAEALDLKDKIEAEGKLLKALLDGRDIQEWPTSLKRKFGDGDAVVYRRLSEERNHFVSAVMKRESNPATRVEEN